MTDLIGGYEKHLRRLRRAATTIDSYVGILRRVDHDIPVGLAAACTEELEEWVAAGKRTEATQAHYITILRGFGAWATDPYRPPGRTGLDYDATAELPKLKEEHEKEVRPATEDELADVLARAKMPYLDLYILAAFHGMRCIEISRIRREDMGPQETRLFGKGDKFRTVPTHPVCWERFKDRQGALARSSQGHPLTREQVISWGNRHLKRTLGHTHLSMHCFRKRYGTQVYELSAHDIRAVQDLLGHSSVRTTERYVAVNRGRQAAAVASLPVPDGARRAS